MQRTMLLITHNVAVRFAISEENMVPNLTESASIDKEGVINITLTNLSADKAYDIRVMTV